MQPPTLAKPAPHGPHAGRKGRPPGLASAQEADDLPGIASGGEGRLRLAAKGWPGVGPRSLSGGHPGNETRTMEAEGTRAGRRQASRRAPHVEEARLEVPARPARQERRRPVGGAQPDAHPTRQVQRRPRALPGPDTDRAGGTAPETPLLVETPGHGPILPSWARRVCARARPLWDVSVSLGVPIGRASEVQMDPCGSRTGDLRRAPLRWAHPSRRRRRAMPCLLPLSTTPAHTAGVRGPAPPRSRRTPPRGRRRRRGRRGGTTRPPGGRTGSG